MKRESPRKPFKRISFVAALIVISACASGAARPSPAPGGAWTTYRGDLARDGHPPTATLQAAAAAHLQLSWRAAAGAAIEGSPAIAGGAVIVTTEGGRVLAFDSTTGAPIWQASGMVAFSGSPTIAGGVVVVGSLAGHVYALNARSGAKLWDWHAPGVEPAIWSSPALVGGLVVVGIGSQYGDTPLEAGRMAALDLATGAQRWVMCVEPACAPGGGVWSTPAIDDAGRGFVGTGNPDDGVLAFDVATGRRLWSTSFYSDEGRDLDVGATPILLQVAGREAVAEGSNGGVFELLDAATGAVIWSRHLVDGSAVHGLIASPAFDGARLYVPSASPPTGLFALSPSDGATQWRSGTDLPVYSAPAVGNGVVMFGTGAVFGDPHSGSILAVSAADGSVLWSYDAHSTVFSAPAIAGSTVVVGDSSGDVLAFQPRG